MMQYWIIARKILENFHFNLFSFPHMHRSIQPRIFVDSESARAGIDLIIAHYQIHCQDPE